MNKSPRQLPDGSSAPNAKFEALARALVGVPKSEVAALLEEERKAKTERLRNKLANG
jgi:hypothetical protein